MLYGFYRIIGHVRQLRVVRVRQFVAAVQGRVLMKLKRRNRAFGDNRYALLNSRQSLYLVSLFCARWSGQGNWGFRMQEDELDWQEDVENTIAQSIQISTEVRARNDFGHSPTKRNLRKTTWN